MNQTTKKNNKQVKTKKKAVLFRLKETTIDYLRGEMDEDAQSVPAAGTRIIEQKRREDEKRRAGG